MNAKDSTTIAHTISENGSSLACRDNCREVMGLPQLYRSAIFRNDVNQNTARNGVNSAAFVYRQKLIGCKPLK
jgi:hypothetical protein